MATCPDCGGSKYITVIDPIANYADVGGGVSFSLPVPCSRCMGTGAVPDAAPAPQDADAPSSRR